MTVQVPEEYNPLSDDWNKLTTTADTVLGADLINDEIALDKLMGVPFMITKVVYRPGVQRKGAEYRDDYVSCEAVVAPAEVLQKRANMGRLDLSKISVDAGEMIVFNDGSTGIYRQITQYLHAKGFITLPDPVVSTGGKGECSYDLPRSQWETGAESASSGIPVRLFCPRGLRYSEYTNEYTGGEDAKTRYIG